MLIIKNRTEWLKTINKIYLRRQSSMDSAEFSLQPKLSGLSIDSQGHLCLHSTAVLATLAKQELW